MINKKIVFMGTPQYATTIFQRLYEDNYNIIALFTQPDKKVGRKQLLTPPHIKQFAIDNGLSLPIYQPTTLKNDAIYSTIKNLKPDFIIVAAFGQILPQNILDIAPCINLHASLLPLYRGASPIQQCLLNGDKYTGVTAMFMEAGLDSGDILGLKYIKIKKNMDVEYLFDKLSYLASDIIIDVLNNFDNIKPKKQNLAKVTHCGKIEKQDGLVKFDNALNLSLKYRAFKFWPGIFLDNGLKLKELELYDEIEKHKAGEILEILDDSIVVGCEIGTIKLKTVQQPSKKAMNVLDYIRGKRLEVGTIIS